VKPLSLGASSLSCAVSCPASCCLLQVVGCLACLRDGEGVGERAQLLLTRVMNERGSSRVGQGQQTEILVDKRGTDRDEGMMRRRRRG
jgi:hypothetical protein